jgi:predicted  nucleic acid-binding Zn-ribbon protein
MPMFPAMPMDIPKELAKMAKHLEALRPSTNASEQTKEKARAAIARINKRITAERRRINQTKN